MGQFAGFFLESYSALNCARLVVVSNSGKDGVNWGDVIFTFLDREGRASWLRKFTAIFLEFIFALFWKFRENACDKCNFRSGIRVIVQSRIVSSV